MPTQSHRQCTRTLHREADYLFHDDLAPVTTLIRGQELLEAAGMG